MTIMTNEKYVDIYLISDFTGETVSAIARSILSQFPTVNFREHTWPLVINIEQINKVIHEVHCTKGIVLSTIFNRKMQDYLIKECNKNGSLCIPVLLPIIDDVASYLNIARVNTKPNRNLMGYYNRFSAIEFTLSHDDGNKMNDLDDADIIILGISRTSKSPTSLYLAYRGYKVANIPLFGSMTLNESVLKFSNKKLIVGFTIDSDILINIRSNRLGVGCQEDDMRNKDCIHSFQGIDADTIELPSDIDYINISHVHEEIRIAQKIFTNNGWPIINVSHRSVEEIAAIIIKYYHIFQSNHSV